MGGHEMMTLLSHETQHPPEMGEGKPQGWHTLSIGTRLCEPLLPVSFMTARNDKTS
jgi:hypothetical protein